LHTLHQSCPGLAELSFLNPGNWVTFDLFDSNDVRPLPAMTSVTKLTLIGRARCESYSTVVPDRIALMFPNLEEFAAEGD